MSDKMHNQKKSSVISLGRKALSAAVASSLLMMSSAHATGLGKLTVLSALGQPLRAEIELTSPSKEEIDSLVPKLASAEAFKQANIDFNSALLSLRFAVEQRGSNYVIRISSAQVMNEPFVDMLLELNSANGKLLREYTFLLDPAELRNSQSAQVSNPTTVNSVANQPQSSSSDTSPAKRSAGAAPFNAPVNKAVAKNVEAPREVKSAGEYQVKSGDTLSKIAGNYRAEGISLDQMLVGLYRANPQAFSGNNMNRLKSGQILTIPDADSVRANVGATSEAHSVVVAHATDFNAYRNKLAGQVAEAPAEKTPSTKQSGGGKITAKVKEVPNPAADSPDKLKLSKVGSASAQGKGASEEDRLAKEKAAQETNARVKELEKNVSDLQKLLEMQKLEVKNKEMAAKQAELSKAHTDAKASTPAASANVPPPVVAAPASVASAAPVPAHASASASAASTPASATPAPASSAASSQASAPASSPAAAAASAASVAAVKPPVKRKIVAPPPPPPEPSFFDSISDYLLPGGIAILAVLGGVGVWTTRRKKKLQQFEDSILTGSSMKANSMFGSTGGQSVDTNNSVFNSNFAPSASQLDANEVDPVAEADVYIAYGRDSQAEEILKEALRTQPDRHAVRVKLLEIYFARKDAKTFERLASELYGMTSGEGDDWAQAASMGIVLEPGNPLYAGGKAKAEVAAGAGLGSGTQPLEDLDPEALLTNSLSQDMLEAISIIDTAQRDSSSPAQLQPEAEAPVLDASALDFDLDIPGESVPEVPKIPEPAAKATPAEEPAAAPEVDFGTIDFDFGSKEPEHAAPSLMEAPAIVPEPEADKFELDLGHLDFAAPPAEPEALTLDNMLHVDESKHDEGQITASLPEESVVAEALPEISSPEALADPASAFEFDLSGIDLDLEPAHAAEAAVAHGEPAVTEAPAHNAEMATKLDLAVAYHEIGDKEGARELLEEVLKGGTSEQVERAKSMMSQMA